MWRIANYMSVGLDESRVILYQLFLKSLKFNLLPRTEFKTN